MDDSEHINKLPANLGCAWKDRSAWMSPATTLAWQRILRNINHGFPNNDQFLRPLPIPNYWSPNVFQLTLEYYIRPFMSAYTISIINLFYYYECCCKMT